MILSNLDNKPLWAYSNNIYVDSFVEPIDYKPILPTLLKYAYELSIKQPIIIHTVHNRYSYVDNNKIYLNLIPALLAYQSNTLCSYHEYEHIKEDPDIGSFLFISWKEYIARELCHEYAHLMKYSGVITKNYPCDDSSHDDKWQSAYHLLISQLTQLYKET